LQVAVQYVLIQGRCYWRRKVHFVITGGGWGEGSLPSTVSRKMCGLF